MKNKVDSEFIKNDSVFCIMPWVHFHALPNKKVLPCCMSNSDMPVSATDATDVITMMNSDEYKKLRIGMLTGKRHSMCDRCYDVERLGQWSLRQSNNAVRGYDNIDAVNATNEDGSIDEFKLQYVDIRWSNICNFKCRSCGPEFSSLHAKEFIEHKGGQEKLKKYFRMDNMVVSCNETGEFFEKVKPYLKDTKEVYFAGGESLITNEHYKMLDEWIKLNNTDIRLTYTTNFSVFKFKGKDVINYWKKFKNIQIFASLDGMGKNLEYLRSGAEWKEIENNIKMLKEQVPHVQFNLTPTISIWNVWHFPDFFDYLVKNKYIDPTDSQCLRLNMLTNPWWANISILPSFYKDRLFLKWNKIKENQNYVVDVRNAAALVQETLKGETRVDGVKEFFEIQEQTDELRNESWIDVIPELEDVYEWMEENS